MVRVERMVRVDVSVPDQNGKFRIRGPGRLPRPAGQAADYNTPVHERHGRAADIENVRLEQMDDARHQPLDNKEEVALDVVQQRAILGFLSPKEEPQSANSANSANSSNQLLFAHKISGKIEEVNNMDKVLRNLSSLSKKDHNRKEKGGRDC